ncbi:hypothetical protein F5H01DRAFT_54982 [Linnemannia elongata]|nr:hypothetical protein F5H01DRAFT_54982 [Linnemannia elongata]
MAKRRKECLEERVAAFTFFFLFCCLVSRFGPKTQPFHPSFAKQSNDNNKTRGNEAMGERVTIERDKRKKNPLSFYPLERRSQSGIPACTSVGPIVYFAMQNFVNSSPTARTSSAKLFDMKEINGLTLNGQPAETKQRGKRNGRESISKNGQRAKVLRG